MTSSAARFVDVDDVVVVDGEIDSWTAGVMRARLGQAMGAPASTVVLDASAVTAMDGAGLRELVAARAKLRASGRHLELRSPSAAVTRLLEVSGRGDDFGLVTTGPRLHLVPPLTR